MGVVIDITDIVWTIAVLIVCMIAVVATTVDVLAQQASGNPLSFSIEFIRLDSQPYILMSSIMNIRSDKRSEFEKLFQESVHHGSAMFNPGEVRKFLNNYDLRKFIITSNGEYLARRFMQCGPDLKGFCADRPLERKSRLVMGIDIVPTIDECPGNSFCYTERIENSARIPDENERQGFNEVIACGTARLGVCAAGCIAGRIESSDSSECSSVNGGGTPVCCLPLSSQQVEDISRESVASVPLLYRDHVSDITVVSSE